MSESPDGASAPVANGQASAPQQQGAEAAVETARTFVSSVAWGEHHRVWDLLAEEGRRTIFRVALARGMDEALVARLREGTAAHAEREEFLTDLVNGLRADLQGVDIDAIDFEPDPTFAEAGRARVAMTARLPASLADMGSGLPAGAVELAQEGGGWKVERVVPRTSP